MSNKCTTKSNKKNNKRTILYIKILTILLYILLNLYIFLMDNIITKAMVFYKNDARAREAKNMAPYSYLRGDGLLMAHYNAPLGRAIN
jgi:hypothetical protein